MGYLTSRGALFYGILLLPAILFIQESGLNMHLQTAVSSLLATLPALSYALPTLSYGCKPLPGEAAWPDASAWKALNSSVSGRLIAPVAPGAVCHSNQPQYDNASCAQVAGQWSNTEYHAQNPFSVDYNDDTCPPYANTTVCSSDGYPAYVISALNAQDVQEGIKFAAKTGVRLVVKATGHDFAGRSSGPGSLSIFMGRLQGLNLTVNDPRATKYGGYGSLKIGAGQKLGDIYKFAAMNKITIIGGADPGVGIMGWATGGGHGPLTAKYGLGVDNVLEMEVVTPSGELRTINENQDSDLFWALRGGGGGTFAIVTSITMKVYPPTQATAYTFSYNTTANSNTFWKMNTFFHQQIPRLVEAGIMGYFDSTPEDSSESDLGMKGKITGIWIAPGKSVLDVIGDVLSMENQFRFNSWGDYIHIKSLPVGPLDFSSAWLATQPDTVGKDVRLGGRLLDKAALSKDDATLEKALRAAIPAGWTELGHLVSSPGAAKPPGGIPGGNNSVLPAWRNAYAHIVTPGYWPQSNETQKAFAVKQIREKGDPALKSLAPNTGAYRSEADPTEQDWQNVFFGSNYARLLEIKKKWDPQGVFWCKSCVGSELWDAQGSDGLDNGVGQNKVRLCSKA